jgi:aminopeptidase N
MRSGKPWAHFASLLLCVLLAPPLLTAQPAELLARPEHFERSRDYDALHYRLVFVFNVGEKSYRGENTITLASLKDGLAACVLDAEGFAVESAATPDGAALPYSYKDAHLAVTLPRPLSYGEKVSIVVRFSQKNPKTGMKFIDAAASHPAQINTYSWPEDAHHWFPCFDDPIDKVTDEVIATVPGDFKVLSNGRLEGMSEDRAAGTKTWHWSQDKPHPVYCIMLAAGPYEIVKDSLGDLPVDAWVYPKDVADAPRSFRKTPKMIEFYGRVFQYAYPWAKYDQVCVAGYGGGMEATTATILGQGTIHDARADGDFPSDSLVAHELAHMWWGDLVTERSWADVWLSESFATYSEYLFTRFDRGEDEGALNLDGKKDEYLREARDRYIRPIVFNRYIRPWDIMDGHSYPKGAAVLHMLRFVLGDEAFFRTLGRFLAKFAFGNADTHDFMNCVKDTTGKNLDWFFEQWLFRPGHPVFEISKDWDEGAKKLRLRVRQVQDFSKGIPVFRTPVVIGIRTADGARSEKVWIEKADESFTFPLPEEPLFVRFDEGNFLLKELTFKKPVEELVFGLRNDDVIGRIRAAGELSGFRENPSALRSLREAAETDRFWAVRRAAVEAAADLPDPGREAFLKRMTGDEHSQVRAAAVRSLGRMKIPRLARFFEDVFRRDPSYVVQAEALTAVGESGRPAEIPFLKKAAELASPRGMLRRSAQAAIKKIEAAAARKTPLVTEGAAREQNPPATPSGISGNPMTGNPSSEVIL